MARFFLLPTSCPPRQLLHHSFLSLVNVLTAALLSASLVSFTRRGLVRRATRCITRLFLLMSCPARRSLDRSFGSLVEVLPAAPLAAFLVSFSCRGLARHTARFIARLFLVPTFCPPCRWLYHLFRSLVQVLPAAPLAASLVCFFCRRLAFRAARCITRFCLLLTSCAPRRMLNRSFVSLAVVLSAALLAASLVSFPCGLLARRASRRIPHFFRSRVGLLDAPLPISLASSAC
jgi:hypothetical protein